MATNFTSLNPSDYFLWRYLKDRVFHKNPHTIPELKTAIQSETEAISAETLAKILKSFALST
jgi:hypothetical protein